MSPEVELRVDWPACRARGLCAELLPEQVALDEWGYPVVEASVRSDLVALAEEVVDACPHRALRLVAPAGRGSATTAGAPVARRAGTTR